jgi:S-DNA-T family DNA segregation ATPase FtsK/SpoIIIE
MVKVPRSRRAASQPPNRRAQDICGLTLFFLGAAGLLCLCWNQPGLLPAQVDALLRLIAGSGSYAIPFLMMFAGAMFLLGYERLNLTHSSYGSLLLFVVFVTGRHLMLTPDPAHWDSATIREAGGVTGWLFGAPLYALVGKVISSLFLVMIAIVAVILLVDQPFIEIVRRLHARGRDGASLLHRYGLIPTRERETALVGQRAARPAPRSLPAPAEPNDDRAERAARVVERALKPGNASRQATLDLPDPEEAEEDVDPNEATTSSKLFRMFALTRNWRNSQGEIEHGDETPEPPVTISQSSAPTEAPIGKVAPAKRASRPAPASDADTASDPAGQSSAPLPIAPLTPPPPAPKFVLPPLTLLKESPVAVSKRSQSELTDRVQTIERTLEQFNIGANVVEVASGPSVTRYEIQLAPGIKVSKIVSLADNLAMSLAAIDVRVEAPIPGKSAIGLEVPNVTSVLVSLRECLDQDEFKNASSKLTVALGKDVAGQYRYADLTRMPHLLIGGSTNSGKSVCLNVLIASLVYRNTPRDVQMLMIDPKRVELSLWKDIPHLMHPVVTDVKQASGVFRAALKEMDRRYDLFAAIGTRNIDGYNAKMTEDDTLPYLVLIVDELADLMMQQGPEIETSICRLAQLARATGIHLVIATQRPSVDIITGTIKANISSRIAFAVASQVDSRTILDMTGADRLIGRGDMLFMPIDAAKPVRIQGCYLSETETNALVEYLKEQSKPNYTITVPETGGTSANSSGGDVPDDVDDAFFEQAVRLVVNNGQASTSMLQRRFRIGYTRAARIVEMMEEKGIVGALNGAKPRELLVSKDQVEQMFRPGSAIPSVEAYQDK